MLLREYLDRVFRKRLSEQIDNHVVMSNRAVDEGEDVKLAAHNKANRHPTQDMSELEDTMNTKKRRPGRISNQMKSVRDGNKASSPDSSGPGGLLNIYNSHDTAEDGVGHSTMSEFTRSFQPKKRSHVARPRMLKHLGTAGSYPPVADQTRIPKMSHFHELGEPWRKPLVYPKDGKKKSTVEWTDLDRLDEGEFFNDTLISFYLRYLEHKLEERNAETAKRVYLFNSFFYASLTKPHKGKKGINYEAVQKWTRGVDIFNCDYVVVPINESLHWYFAVICNLPALHRDFSNCDEDIFSSPPPDTSSLSRQREEHEPNRLPLDTANLQAEDSAIQSMRPAQVTPASTEEDTRSSFADLSLDQGDELIDRDILNAQPTCKRAEVSASSDQAPQIQAIVDEHMTVVDASAEPESPIAASSSRKRKRKSLPPGKKLDPTGPAIVTFDSLAVAHAPTVRTLKDYLKAEAHSKRSMAFDDSQLKGMTAVGIPKQDNYCDCGPYLLGYMDKFLEDPKDFMEKTMRKQLDPERDWPQLDPSNLRSSIRELIIKLHNQQENERKVGVRKDSKVQPSRQPEARSSPDHVFIEEQDVTTTITPTPTAQAEPIPSDIYQTRTEALKPALIVDEAEAAGTVPPHISQTMSERSDSSLDEKQSVNLVDVNPAQSQPAVQRSNVASSEVHMPEDSPKTLPSTIQDSQPQESFQFLEELQPDSTGTLLRQLNPLPSGSTNASPAEQGTIDRLQGQDLMHPTPPPSKAQSKHHFFVQID